MLNAPFHIAQLIAGRLNGTLDADQEAELDQWLQSNGEHQKYLEQTFYDEDNLRELLTTYHETNGSTIWTKITEKIKVDHQLETRVLRPLSLWIRFAAAAIFLILGSGLFFLMKKQQPAQTETVKMDDIKPGTTTATLLLADGRLIRLTDSVNGELAHTSGVLISRTAKGQLVYTVKDKPAGAVNRYNTLYTAKGETFQVVLPDGSKVWLNAASILRYPVSFAGIKNREVELLGGEAYFEVTKDKAHPFIVNSSKQRVEVLGTHFNINTYTDDAEVKTTLLEGKVSISYPFSDDNNRHKLILLPGQQSKVSATGISLVKEVNMEDIMAWKEGYFNFNEDIDHIMIKLIRWYDIRVVYKESTDTALKLRGKISRTKNLSEILKMLSYTSGMNFKIEGRSVIVEK